MCAQSKEIAQQQKGGTKEEGDGIGEASSSHKAGKTRDFRQPSQALKEGKTLEMLTAKNHTAGGYRTDDGYVFSPGDVISDTGDGFYCAPWRPFPLYSKECLIRWRVSSSTFGIRRSIWPSDWELTPSWSKHRARAKELQIKPLQALGSKRATSHQPVQPIHRQPNDI